MLYKNTVGSVDIHIDTKRMESNLRNAQKLLNMQIVADCDPYIPFQQGGLRESVRYPDGIYGGIIEFNAPYAHYQYMGELYLTEDGRSWASKGERKYPTDRPLVQHEPGTTDHWFDAAKQAHGSQWLDLVRREAGKG